MKHLFIVGAQRSGSTYLYHLLDAHPQISMAHPVRPEPKFFLDAMLVDKGRAFYESQYFQDCKPGSLYLGEKSTSYIESADVARRIHEFYPNARILVIFRDPVQRAYSNYCFSRDNGLETLEFAEALAVEAERIKAAAHKNSGVSVSPFAYRQRGFYPDYLAAYLEVFGSRQVKVLILEELNNSIADVQALYAWLGVDAQFIPQSIDKVFNTSMVHGDAQKQCLLELAEGYRPSIAALEKILNRPIDVWRNSHRLLGGSELC